MRIEERQPTATAEQILGEIREFCRATQTAESTFGRLVVNDGKLVSRLRDGAKITTGTLDKVRAYLQAISGGGSPGSSSSITTPYYTNDIASGLSAASGALNIGLRSGCSERRAGPGAPPRNRS